VKLAFSTLACPSWAWRDAISTARRLGYDGLEWRLVDGEFVTADFPEELAAEIGSATSEAGLGVPALDSSISLTAAPGPLQDKVVEDTRRLLHLARAFGAEFLRVFPGTYPESVTEDDARRWVTEVLEAVRPDAARTGVRIALELHDSFGWDRAKVRGVTCSGFVADVLRAVDMPEVGVQWDLGNPFMEGESAAATWENVRPWLLYLQLKDMVEQPGGGWRYVPIGEGQLPLRDVLAWIGGRDFAGWVSFEWEKKWHPELAEPETVLPGYLAFMDEYRPAR
jgi:sugar phosphate isomerase/epimerase